MALAEWAGHASGRFMDYFLQHVAVHYDTHRSEAMLPFHSLIGLNESTRLEV